MRIVFHGARGSVPVSGPEYLAYGGDTTCVEIRGRGGEVAVIDAGTGIRRLGIRLAEEGCRHIHLLFTHTHWDHILGFPFFRPIYRPDTVIEVHGCAPARHSVRAMLSKTMSAPSFPVEFESVQARFVFHDRCERPVPIGGLTVSAVPLSHPNQGLGYRFDEGTRSFVFLTDHELGFTHPGGAARERYLEFCRGADLLVHDAEFTPREYPERRGWGHSSWEDALLLAREAGASRLGLWHHNAERRDEEMERLLADCRRAAEGGPEVFAARQGQELDL